MVTLRPVRACRVIQAHNHVLLCPSSQLFLPQFSETSLVDDSRSRAGPGWRTPGRIGAARSAIDVRQDRALHRVRRRQRHARPSNLASDRSANLESSRIAKEKCLPGQGNHVGLGMEKRESRSSPPAKAPVVTQKSSTEFCAVLRDDDCTPETR